MGRRLGKYTRDNTKCMLPVNGVRLIDRMLNQLAKLPLERVVIVVGYKGKELIDYIGNRYDDRLHIEYHENPIYDKTNNIYSLAIVKQQLTEDDTLLLESDLIMDDGMLPLLLNDPRPNLALVSKYETWMDGTMVTIDDDFNIESFVTKKAFKYSDTDRYYKTVNVYKFSCEFASHVYVPMLEAYLAIMGNDEYYEQALRVLTLIDKTNLKALPVGNMPWYEIDDVQDLDIAEAIFAEPHERLAKYGKRYGGYWRFPHLLDFCYLVNPYFPTPRMKDEMRANFDTLLTQYPSGMGVCSLIAGKCFNISDQYTVVGNGAAELIKSLMESLPASGKVGIVYPTFEEYPHRLPHDAIVPFHASAPDFTYTADDLMQHYATTDLAMLVVVNPDNPSGNLIPLADVERLAQWCSRRGTRLLLDESFVDFADAEGAGTLLIDATLERHTNLLVMKSISKSFGVPGLRLGILASGDTDLIAAIKKDVAIWNINSFAEFYLQIYDKYSSFYATACTKFKAERARFLERLRQVPYLRVIPSQANYFLCEVTGNISAHDLTERLLLDHNILIKDCNNKTGLTGKNYIRIAVRDHHDNDTLVDALLGIRL